MTKSRIYLILVFLLVALLSPTSAWAEVYGGQNYGNCEYSRDCAASPSTTTTSDDGADQQGTEPTAGTGILLNDFNEYFTTGGKQLTLDVGQIVYFYTTSSQNKDKNSVTVKEVGDNWVIIEVNSSLQTAKLLVGESKQFDVNGDNRPDIEVSLVKIVNGKAVLGFKNLQPDAINTSITTPVKARKSFPWPYLGISIVGLSVFTLLFIRRIRRNRNATF